MTQQPYQSFDDTDPIEASTFPTAATSGDAFDAGQADPETAAVDEPDLGYAPVFREPIVLESVGVPGVDAALAPLTRLAEAPITEHPNIYEGVHTDLEAALDELEQPR